jgi:hypothetical protein
MKRFMLGLIMIGLVCPLFAAKGTQSRNHAMRKTATLDNEIRFDVNRMSGLMRNNGIWFMDVQASDWGLEWPKGSELSPIYAGGQWISAKVGDDVRVAAVIHDASEFQPGMILPDGTPDNPRNSEYRWYVINSGGVGDWDSWPVNQGAPVDAGGRPMLIGDRTAFCVWNDKGEHLEFATNKLGVEVRQTVFGFDRADALGDMAFIKWLMVNKSDADWDSSYFSIWMDPDIGDGNDDLVGCSPDLGLGFCYNGTNEDQNYGAAPPAAGVDFFQGPIVDEPGSSVALPDGRVLQDKKMLKMTAFIFYNNDDSNQGNPDASTDVWNYQRGFWRDYSAIVDPTGAPTPFMYYGDPETGSGWLDSSEDDRRFLMTTGPFVMPKWQDTDQDGQPELGEPGVQEIVAAVMVARGTSNVNSVTKLKEVDVLAQMAYDLNFNLSRAPRVPSVQTSTLPNEVVLTWDERSEFNEDGTPYESEDPIVANAIGDTVILNNTVKVIDDATYNFYGYTVYQYSDASGADPVEIAHWDVGETADAVPYAEPRYLRILQNRNSIVGNTGDRLINGKTYYFGVVAHAFLEFGAPTVFNSPPAIVAVVPQYTAGARFSGAFQDTIAVTHTGQSDGSAVAWIVDPSKVTGQDYRVTFNDDGSWNLLRGAAGDVLARNESNLTGNDAYNVIDGLMIKVMGPQMGINFGLENTGWSTDETGATRWISGTDIGITPSTFFGGLTNGTDYWGVTANRYVDVKLEFKTDPGPDSANWSKAYVLRRDLGYAFDGIGWFPGKLWDVSTVPPTQLNLAFVEDARLVPSNHFWDMGWDPNTSSYANDGANGNQERIWMLESPYDAGTNTALQTADWYDGSTVGLMYHLYPRPRPRADGSLRPFLEADLNLFVYASKPNTPEDVFTFTTSGYGSDLRHEYAAEDLKRINVVPNPYYGYHSGEMNAFDRWMQFTLLPEKCTIRVFDLAGNLVRKMAKDARTPFLRWDMKNEYGLPVASGIYVYHVEAPGIGDKIGKLAVFAPNERLDTY